MTKRRPDGDRSPQESRPDAGSGTLLLYTQPGCHLCDDARVVLERIGAPFEEVDITTDDALHAAYLERIPVVALDGEELFDFFVDEAALRDRLDRVDSG
jgi:glutaredoxin